MCSTLTISYSTCFSIEQKIFFHPLFGWTVLPRTRQWSLSTSTFPPLCTRCCRPSFARRPRPPLPLPLPLRPPPPHQAPLTRPRPPPLPLPPTSNRAPPPRPTLASTRSSSRRASMRCSPFRMRPGRAPKTISLRSIAALSNASRCATLLDALSLIIVHVFSSFSNIISEPSIAILCFSHRPHYLALSALFHSFIHPLIHPLVHSLFLTNHPTFTPSSLHRTGVRSRVQGGGRRRRRRATDAERH
jgi:hypothetical protein